MQELKLISKDGVCNISPEGYIEIEGKIRVKMDVNELIISLAGHDVEFVLCPLEPLGLTMGNIEGDSDAKIVGTIKIDSIVLQCVRGQVDENEG